MNLENYTITKTGQDAFEEDHQWAVIVFETGPNVFMWWNPSNYLSELPPYNDGLPPNYETIVEVHNNGYGMPELAQQVGALRAWGLDL